MSHLRLVPSLPAEPTGETGGTVEAPAPRTPWDDPKVALAFFQQASGMCLCRKCTMERHPAYGAR
jgi:hypothetical protein